MTTTALHRFFVEPKQSYFLFGPRGTGKSTLISTLHKDACIINLLDSKTLRLYQSQPERLLETVRAQAPGSTILLDEIQRLPELLPLVHLLIEEKQNWQFILTGSSARKLKRESVDLLGGRALKKSLYPFMAAELGYRFHLEDALQYGLLPLRFASANPAETLQTYVSLYLEEEVKFEGLVRKIEPFTRFLESLSFSHGSLLNMSNLARECGIKRSTADSWLEIVEDLLIAFRLPVFTRRAKRVLVAQSKLYLFDAGVFQALRPQSILDTQSEINGAALEGLVAQHLMAWISYHPRPYTLSYWRTKAGLEVDFIVHGKDALIAIEVKHSEHIHPGDLRSLKHFKEDYPESTCLLLYRGSEKRKIGDVLCLPVADFLRKLHPEKPMVETKMQR